MTNLDRLRDADDIKVAEFLIDVFDQLGKPVPMNLCANCIREC